MKKNRSLFIVITLFLTLVLTTLYVVRYISNSSITNASELGAQTTIPQWHMAGHDNERSSWEKAGSFANTSNPAWHKLIAPFIPSKAQLVTVAGSSSADDMIYVSTSEGLYALYAANGNTKWIYKSFPVGHSPTYVNGVLYFGSLDKTVHAVNAVTGAKVWQTDEAEAGFDTSPLIVNGKVLLGSRDGYFYAFSQSNGAYLWSYKTGGPISYSAAYKDGIIYFASNDSYAYALNENGTFKWKSAKLPGNGFYSWWPVIYGDYVLFAGTNNYPLGNKLFKLDRDEAFLGVNNSPLPDAGSGWLNAKTLIDYYAKNPSRRTFFTFNRHTGTEIGNPVIFVGDPSSDRPPPFLGPEGVYIPGVFKYSSDYLKGRFFAWKPGTNNIKLHPGLNVVDSQDEFLIGVMLGDGSNAVIAYNHKDDQNGGFYDLLQNNNSSKKGTWKYPDLLNYFPNYDQDWNNRRYGNWPSITSGLSGAGSTGHQNPPVPIRDKACFHRSNNVMCMKK